MSKERVLVVDDEKELCNYLARVLENEYEVRVLQDSRQVLDTVQAYRPRLVLLDYLMPEMDGLEVLLQITRRFEEMGVIMLTGAGSEEVASQAVNMGAVGYLIKPIIPEELRRGLNGALERLNRREGQRLRMQETIRELEERTLSLESQLEHNAEEIIKTQNAAIFTLARLAEYRDHDTGAHLERMRIFSLILADTLKKSSPHGGLITDAYVFSLSLSSILHDIGKVGIPDAILLKTGRLTGQEFEVMKTHTSIGANALAAAEKNLPLQSFLSMGREICLCHHERWDGRGYPRGLKRDEIPLSARIITLADVYDSLTSRRPYKQAYSHEVARNYVVNSSERHFDPSVVDAFLEREAEFNRVQRASWELGEEGYPEI